MAHGNDATVIARLLVEVWGQGDLSLLPELVSQDITAHLAAAGEPLHGIEAYREFIAAYHGIYGQVRFTVDDQLQDGNKVATRWTAHLEAGQSALPELATEAREVMGMNISVFADGKITQCWDTWDSLAALQGAEGTDMLQRLSFTI